MAKLEPWQQYRYFAIRVVVEVDEGIGEVKESEAKRMNELVMFLEGYSFIEEVAQIRSYQTPEEVFEADEYDKAVIKQADSEEPWVPGWPPQDGGY